MANRHRQAVSLLLELGWTDFEAPASGWRDLEDFHFEVDHPDGYAPALRESWTGYQYTEDEHGRFYARTREWNVFHQKGSLPGAYHLEDHWRAECDKPGIR